MYRTLSLPSDTATGGVFCACYFHFTFLWAAILAKTDVVPSHKLSWSVLPCYCFCFTSLSLLLPAACGLFLPWCGPWLLPWVPVPVYITSLEVKVLAGRVPAVSDNLLVLQHSGTHGCFNLQPRSQTSPQYHDTLLVTKGPANSLFLLRFWVNSSRWGGGGRGNK